MKKNEKLLSSFGNHPVVGSIFDRLNGKETTSRLALVVEGGGIKAAATGAMVAELERIGIKPNVFDLIIGTSAGSFNIAYYIAEQARQGVTIYSKHLKDQDFINFYRGIYGRPIMDHGILLDHIMETVVPLDWQKVIDSKKFYSIATNPASKIEHSVTLGPPQNKVQLKQFLRASAHIPVIAGKPPTINNVRLYDGGMTAMLPIDQAVNLGATHILALSARNLGAWKSSITNLEKLFLYGSSLRWPGFNNALYDRVKKNSVQSKTFTTARLNPSKPPYILVLDCPDLPEVNRFEKNTAAISQAVESGSQVIQAAFG